MEIQNLQHLRELVVEKQGVMTVTMKVLKDAAKQGESLKKYVRENISKELQKVGLTHAEEELPNSQSARVRIYQSGSPVATIIRAAMTTDEAGEYDETLRKAGESNQTDLLVELRSLRDEAEILDKIRAILQCNEE